MSIVATVIIAAVACGIGAYVTWEITTSRERQRKREAGIRAKTLYDALVRELLEGKKK